MKEFGVKFKMPGEKAFYFVTPRGGGTRLKVHAARFANRLKALAFIEANSDDNPGVAWRTQEL